MLKNDLPIKSCSNDELNRAYFSCNLAKAILSYGQTESFVIGLNGKWGAGKTSVINMVEEKLNEFGNNKEMDKSIIMKFNPWNFSNQDQLIVQFFKQLSSTLKKDNYNKKLSAVGEILESYSDMFNISGLIPQIGVWGAVFALCGKAFGKGAKRLAEAGKADIHSIKTKIVKELSKSKQKIVIIIDDIDRLSNEEIRTVFKLVKSLADFPNTIYLLAFDRDIVVKALEKVQEGDGGEYLEKIVQLPFELPEASKSEICRIFFNKIGEIVAEVPDEKWDKVYWSEIFEYGIKNYIDSIRDVYRLVNLFSVKYAIIKDETNIIDLIALTAIQVFEPELYSLLPNYKDDLCGTIGYSFGSSYSDMKIKSTKQAYENLIEHIDIEKKPFIEQILYRMFPRLSEVYNASMIRYYDEYNSLISSSICNEKCFNTYFVLTLDKRKMSSTLSEKIIFDTTKEEFIEKLKEISNDNKINDFTEILNATFKPLKNTDKHEERVHIILESLIFVWKDLKDSYEDKFLKLPFRWRLNYSTNFLLGVFKDENKRFIIMKEIFINDKIVLYPLVDILSYFENEHGRFTDKEAINETILTLSHVLELEKIIVKRIENEAESGTFINNDCFITLFYFWERIDEESVKLYVNKLMLDEVMRVKFISNMVSRGKGAGRIVFDTWSVDINELGKFFNTDEAYDFLLNLISTKSFNDFSGREKENIAAFLITYEHKDHSCYHNTITLDEISKRLKQAILI